MQFKILKSLGSHALQTLPDIPERLIKLRLSKKQRIQEDIKLSTHKYFKECDRVFTDYIYGDPYYTTLSDVVYNYIIQKKLDWDMEYELIRSIDTVELVSRLYEKFIKVDKYLEEHPAGQVPRYRKNYLMQSLRRATAPILDDQLKRRLLIDELIAQQYKRLNYISLNRDDGQLLEELSLRDWEEIQKRNEHVDMLRAKLEKMYYILNPEEKSVVSAVSNNLSYDAISDILGIEQERVRKLLYSAKIKLKAESKRRSYLCQHMN